DFHRDGRTGSRAGYFELQTATVGNRMVVEFDDDIAVLQTSFVRRTIRNHVANQRALVVFEIKLAGEIGCEALNHHAEITAGDVTGLDEAFHHGPSEIGRNGEADTLIAAGTAQDGGVDADQTAINIDKRTAGIAGVDGGIGLDEVFIIFDAHVAAVFRADD